jgi:carboxypeptidase Taq
MTMIPQAAYDELIARVKEGSLLASCIELLGWDELTYMPRAGAVHRGNQMALLTGLDHAKATDPRIGALLEELEGSDLIKDPLSPAAVNIREIRRVYDRMVRVPRPLMEELARVTTLAQQEWEEARRDADFGRFQPWLEKIVALKRQEADAVGYDTVAYDALLEDYEPGARSAEIVTLFEALGRDLAPLVQALAGARRKADVTILHREFPLDKQRTFGETVAAAVGFDFRGGRLDKTVHPFCSAIGPGDCRLTTRFYRRNFSEAFFGILHEVGHGLYEQGLDPEHCGTPMAEIPSLAMHESQARLWENTIGRSRPFWDHFYPLARELFHDALRDVALEDFHLAVNHVEPSFIRASADEITYNLHILVRFELERALVAGDLETADVPAAWNEAYQRYLGITPPDDAAGCLQDGHWGSGLIGYFPTYTLGNLIAAQLFARAVADLGDLSESFARGQFDVLLGWLRVNVHRQGQRYPTTRLVEQVTGSSLDHRPFVQAMRQKYGELYGIG